MERYYDVKCTDCEKGCAFFGHDAFPNGEPFEVCRYFGYIFHPDKGIAEESCEKRKTREQIRDLQRMLATRQRKKGEQITIYDYLDRK